MTFYEKVQSLCKKRGFEISNLDKALNISVSKSAISKWKNGATPRAATVKAIADYFEVSIDYLTTDAEKEDTASQKIDSDKVIIFHRNGKTESRHFTREQMKLLYTMMDFISSSEPTSDVETKDENS